MKYIARTSIFYISTDTGEEKHVLAGDEFTDMDKYFAKEEADYGNMEIVEGGDEYGGSDTDTRQSG